MRLDELCFEKRLERRTTQGNFPPSIQASNSLPRQ